MRKAASSLGLTASLAILMAAGAVEPAAARNRKERAPGTGTITLRVYDYARVDRRGLLAAEDEATGILSQAGIEARWVDCPTAEAELSQYPDCPSAWQPTDFALRNALPLGRWGGERRKDLVALVDTLDARITALNQEVAREAARRPAVARLMQQPGVGPVTALAFVLTLGPVSRFRRSKQVVIYLGLNPREFSSGGRQRLGAISKQGNTMMRWLLVEAAQTAARFDPELHRAYARLKHRRGLGIARVAVARKLAVRLYWMLRTTEVKAQPVSPQSSPVVAMVEKAPSNY